MNFRIIVSILFYFIFVRIIDAWIYFIWFSLIYYIIYIMIDNITKIEFYRFSDSFFFKKKKL